MGYYLLTDAQVMQGVDYCFDKASRLLDTVGLLLSHDKSWKTSHALGIYTLALEEFGKGLLLNDLYQPGNRKIQIPLYVFKDHDKKINRGIEELSGPDKEIMVGIEVDKPSDVEQTLDFRDGGGMSVSGKKTGLHMVSNRVNLEVRMKCFFVDWIDGRSPHWEYELATTKEYLQNAVSALRIELERQKK